MDGWGDGRWIAMTIFMVVLIGLVTVLVVWLVRTTGGQDRGASSAMAAAEQVLAERFARGEIDEEEFTRRRALLRAGPGK